MSHSNVWQAESVEKQAWQNWLTQFKHPAVRDLAWVIAAPPQLALTGENFEHLDAQWWWQQAEAFSGHLQKLEAEPAPLLQHLERRKNALLGLYFEDLLLYWLQHHGHLEVLHHDLQVHDAGETQGALDFIVRDTRNGDTWHWETAVKFYLGQGDTRQLKHWFGPGLRDRLDQKVDRLMAHQIKVSDSKAGRIALKQIEVNRRAVIVKGRFFYSDSKDAAPQFATAEHQKAWWMTETEFARLDWNDDWRWARVPKHRWLADWCTSTPIDGDADDLLAHLPESDNWQPVCVVAVSRGEEVSRGMLVPDSWPERAEASL